jgi:uncharacterized lipoprotein YajG
MQRKTSIAAKVIVLASAVMLTGCAFVPDTVHPEYKPTANISIIPGANTVDLSVGVKNEKKHPKTVSVTLDGYGIPMAGVYMDVQKDFQNAFITALKSRGFVVDEKSPDKFGVTVIHFYLKEQQHFSAPSHSGYAELHVSIKRNGSTLFSHTFSAHTKFWQNGMAVSSIGRQKTAEITLNKIVNKIVTDPQVIDALFKAAGKTPPADLGVTVPASVASH